MTNYFYCKSWFWAKKRPTEMWTEDQARKAHNDRKTYTVLVREVEHPYAVVEVANDFVALTFLDDLLRQSMSYHFTEVEPGKLFLSMVTHREFDGDTDEVRIGHSYIFNQDGGLIIRKRTFSPNGLEEANSSTDVSRNYEKYPDFGDYEHLLKVER